MANETQLFLLADHIKFILWEQECASETEPKHTSLSGEVARSLSSLRQGLENLEANNNTPTSSQDITELRKQYDDLQKRFSLLTRVLKSGTVQNSPVDDPSRSDQQLDTISPTSSPRQNAEAAKDGSRSVRFLDSPTTHDSRSTQFPYRDHPEDRPDQTSLSNQQIHAYHGEVLEEQDRQLAQLGQSIGRQRELSIHIGDELDEQQELLDEVDEYTTRHQTQLDRARMRLGRISRKAKDNLQLTTILILIIVLILAIVILK